MKTLKLNTYHKYHFLIALIISIWLVAILVLIAPFDVSELTFWARLLAMPIYGLITFVGYMLLIPLQNWIYQKLTRWSLLFEILFLGLFYVIVGLGNIYYYKSWMINGNYSFSKFTLEIYTPIFLIVLPLVVLLRWLLNKKTANIDTSKIILSGDNKLDILHIHFSDLISISSADNYVEVDYLNGQTVNKKLLRTTLKNTHIQAPELVKVHRSHLVNPIHIKEWKNGTTLILTESEVPVSKNYKQDILNLTTRP